jgi:AcrR family transcriptional regulator
VATDIKGRRSRDGKGGQARTRLARRAVVGAARDLFLDRGYAATTIEAIGEESDVPPATVYRLFSSKLGILKALLDVSIAGDDEAVPVQDRPHARALFDDPDPRNQLAGFAGITGGIMSRAEPVYRILVSAAGSDPGAAALLAEQARQRDQGQQQIARSLTRAGALRPGLRERDAADIIHALMSPEVYRLLVGDRGWPPQRYEQWLTDVLTGQLLPPPTTGGGLTDPNRAGRPTRRSRRA